MGCEIPRDVKQEADECDARAEVQRECLENEIKGVLGWDQRQLQEKRLFSGLWVWLIENLMFLALESPVLVTVLVTVLSSVTRSFSFSSLLRMRDPLHFPSFIPSVYPETSSQSLAFFFFALIQALLLLMYTLPPSSLELGIHSFLLLLRIYH